MERANERKSEREREMRKRGRENERERASEPEERDGAPALNFLIFSYKTFRIETSQLPHQPCPASYSTLSVCLSVSLSFSVSLSLSLSLSLSHTRGFGVYIYYYKTYENAVSGGGAEGKFWSSFRSHAYFGVSFSEDSLYSHMLVDSARFPGLFCSIVGLFCSVVGLFCSVCADMLVDSPRFPGL